MKKRTILIGVIVVAAILLGVPYLVYAMNYQGEYEVNVTFNVSSNVQLEIDVTEVETESTAMDTMSFWDVMKGVPTGTICNNSIYVSLNQSGDVKTQFQYAIVSYRDDPVAMSFTFYEMAPGETTLRIYVKNTYLDTIMYDNSWTVIVG